jgi:hypothetical protein
LIPATIKMERWEGSKDQKGYLVRRDFGPDWIEKHSVLWNKTRDVPDDCSASDTVSNGKIPTLVNYYLAGK